MEITLTDGLHNIKFDLVVTLGLAALFLFAGYASVRRVGWLERVNLPAAAVGGILFALLVWVLRSRGMANLAIDTSLRAPLQTVFFTTIGLGATTALLRAGGWRLILFWGIASLLAFVQNGVGMLMAKGLNAPPALGVICGALTLTGGPATGLVRAPDFEALGVTGASALIIASATFGIFCSSLIGNPVATWLIQRFGLQTEDGRASADWVRAETFGEANRSPNSNRAEPESARGVGDYETEDLDAAREAGQPLEAHALLRNLLWLLLIMGVGALLSFGLTKLAANVPAWLGNLLKLPNYIGAMIVAALARYLDDKFDWFKFDARAFDAIGVISLALFLVIALMDLKLWQLAGLAVPMLIILTAQIILMIVYAVGVTFVLMGRDYEAAVTASGHIGFGLGITPNAVANMEALTARFFPAPRSFLIVPVVGGFFIDFTNALVINLFINFMR